MGDLIGAGLGLGNVFEGSIEGQRIEPTSTLTGPQGDLLGAIVQQLLSQFQGGQLQGITPFQGTRPGEVPFGPLQQQGFGLAGGLGPGIGSGLQAFGGFDPTQGQGFLGQAGQGLTAGLGFDPTQDILAAFEPSRQLATRQFEQTTVPSLLSRFGSGSGASGALNKALAEAGADLSLGLSAQTAPFIGQAALNQPGLQFQGAQLGGQLAGVPGQIAQQGLGLGGEGLQQLLGIGGLQQQGARGRAGANQARFLESQAFNNPFLTQFLGQALGTPAFENIAFQGFREPSIFEQVAPVAGAALGAASDKRVKENIEPIDDALEKMQELKGYMFDYKKELISDGNRHGGVMAQDLEKVLPDAVTEIDGIKRVDMNAVIGLLVNAVNELARKVG